MDGKDEMRNLVRDSMYDPYLVHPLPYAQPMQFGECSTV